MEWKYAYSGCNILKQTKRKAHDLKFGTGDGLIGMMQFWRRCRRLVTNDDVIKWKHFRVTGPLCGEFTGHRWIPRTNAGDAELCCFLWSAPEQTVD